MIFHFHFNFYSFGLSIVIIVLSPFSLPYFLKFFHTLILMEDKGCIYDLTRIWCALVLCPFKRNVRALYTSAAFAYPWITCCWQITWLSTSVLILIAALCNHIHYSLHTLWQWHHSRVISVCNSFNSQSFLNHLFPGNELFH